MFRNVGIQNVKAAVEWNKNKNGSKPFFTCDVDEIPSMFRKIEAFYKEIGVMQAGDAFNQFGCNGYGINLKIKPLIARSVRRKSKRRNSNRAVAEEEEAAD